jgi:hypothetical protein
MADGNALCEPSWTITKAALELFLEKAPHRGIAYTWYEKQDEAAITHLQAGEASAKIDAPEHPIALNWLDKGGAGISVSVLILVEFLCQQSVLFLGASRASSVLLEREGDFRTDIRVSYQAADRNRAASWYNLGSTLASIASLRRVFLHSWI